MLICKLKHFFFIESSSLIESSFGGKVSEKTSSIVADDNQFGVKLQKMTISTTPRRDQDFIQISDLNVPTTPKTLQDFTVPSISGLGISGSIGVTTRSSLMRRQSSAFEFSRPESEIAKCMTVARHGPSQAIRRQSSAFEIAAISNRLLNI